MVDRLDLLENKKNEIGTTITDTLSLFCVNDTNSIEIMNNFFDAQALSITPPQEEPPKMYMITLDSLKNYDKGTSIKPGNIKFNIKKLIDILPEVVTESFAMVCDVNILKICAALSIWKKLRNILTVEITKEQAIAIVALWRHCNTRHEITLEDGFNYTKVLFKQIEKTDYLWEDYIKTIAQLESLGSIELNDKSIWLREWTSMNYTK